MGAATEGMDIWQLVQSWLGAADGVVTAILSPIVNPLAEQTSKITGKHGPINDASHTWQTAANNLSTLHDDNGRTVSQVLDSFKGDTSVAYSGAMQLHGSRLAEVVQNMQSTSKYLENASAEINLAENICKTAIQTFIEWAIPTLIAAVANSIWTFGISDAAGAAAVGGEAAVTAGRIAEAASQLATKLEKIEKSLKEVKDTETTLTRVVKTVGAKEVSSAKDVVKVVAHDKEAIAPAALVKTTVVGNVKTSAQDYIADEVDEGTGQDDPGYSSDQADSGLPPTPDDLVRKGAGLPKDNG